MFDAFRAWRTRRQVMRELRAIEQEEARKIAEWGLNPLNLAKTSLELGEFEDALRHWRCAWTQYPHYVKTARDTFDVLLGLKLFDEAEAIMTEGQKRFPRQPRYAEGLAVIAEHRGDREEAVARWERVRKRFPSSWPSYVNAARSLKELGRVKEADRLLKMALPRLPDEVSVWIEYAGLAEHVNDWPLAQVRWKQVSDRFGHVIGALGQARMMVKLGQIEEADRFLTDATAMFTYESDILVAWARIPELKDKCDMALERWRVVRLRFPTLVVGYREQARLLKATGKLAELEILLQDAVERFPSATWVEF